MNKMKTVFRVVAAIFALIVLAGPKLSAGEIYRLEASVYVFKHSDFPAARLPAAKTAGESGAFVVRSPATLDFGSDTLSLKGGEFSWSGRNPPERFSLIAVPAMALPPTHQF